MSVKAGIGWMYRMKGLWDRTELMIAWEANGVAWKRIFEISTTAMDRHDNMASRVPHLCQCGILKYDTRIRNIVCK